MDIRCRMEAQVRARESKSKIGKLTSLPNWWSDELRRTISSQPSNPQVASSSPFEMVLTKANSHDVRGVHVQAERRVAYHFPAATARLHSVRGASTCNPECLVTSDFSLHDFESCPSALLASNTNTKQFTVRD